MKNLILSLAIITTSIVSAQDVKLEVEISGFSNNKGSAMVGLYNTKETFLKKGIKSVKTIVKNKKTYAVFNIPKGEYAISMYHDENANGKLDANFVGMPKEGYGTSNDAKGFMGPPKYDDAKFILTSNKTIAIKIQ